MFRLKAALLSLSLWTTSVFGYANPMSCSGTCTNAHDPSIIRRSDGTYFRFSTGGKIAIHSAPSIQGPWTYKGAAIPNCSKISLSGNCDLWAPDVYYSNGIYYLYYSVSSFGSQNSAIGVATSKSLDAGSWTDLGSTGIESKSGDNFNAIDGNLICGDTTCWMTYGSFWGDIYQIRMADPPTKSLSGSAQYGLSYQPSGTHAEEGAFVFRYGNYFYLFYSAGKCCAYDTSRPAKGDEYKIKVCRSTTPYGGFVDKTGTACTNGGGTVVLESHDFVYGPGGQSVYQDPSMGPVLAYHYVDTRIGYADGQKQFGLNKIDFSSGWPVV